MPAQMSIVTRAVAGAVGVGASLMRQTDVLGDLLTVPVDLLPPRDREVLGEHVQVHPSSRGW
jgi:hypothetical protein